MTRDDIIHMAREAGFDHHTGVFFIDHRDGICTVELLKFAALVAAAEREACAKVCDELAQKDKLSNYYAVAARAIRERNNNV